MKRKILSILLCIAVCITMMPVAAYAEDISTGITIAGTKVTSENAGNITGDNIRGTVSYNVENGNRILTLENATIDGQIRITGSTPVTIKIKGTNTITGPSGSTSENSGIYLSSANLTILGDDSNASLQVTSNGSTAIHCDSSIFFKNVKVTAAGAYGIKSAHGGVEIEQSTISSRYMITASGIKGNEIELTNAEILDPAGASEFKSRETKSLNRADSNANDGLFTISNQFDDYNLLLFFNTKVTSRNVNAIPDIYKESGSDTTTVLRGNLSYNPGSSTLSLTNAHNTYTINHGAESAIIKSGAELKISLKGENSLKNSGDGRVISAAEALTIAGDGSLTAESKNSFGIKCEKKLNITGGTITSIGKTLAIESDSITISGGTIKAKNTSDQDNIVIRSAKPITAYGKMLKLTNCKEIAPGEIQITDGAAFAEISVSGNHTHAYNSENWNWNDKQHWRTCTSDGCAQLDAANHNFGDWTVTEEATSTKKGLKERTCLTCPYKETKEIGIAIDSQNFPDDNFRNIVTAFDTDKDDYLSAAEISKVTGIDCPNKGIQDLAGIEFFTALTDLNCSSNSLTTLDVSRNTELQFFDCSENQLTTLDISKNIALKKFSCNDNLLASLDVSKNVKLYWLNCSSNLLTALDISRNTALEHLNCSYNRLTALDISKNTALTTPYDFMGNAYPIIFTKERTFDLSTLPAFDVSKANDWGGGTVSGKILTVKDGCDEVTYTYNCGGDQTVKFVLKVDGVAGDPISLPVRTIESKDDTDFVLRSNLSASFTPVDPATANTDDLSSYGGARIDYVHPAAATPEAGYTKHAVYQIYIPMTAYVADMIRGILTLPLPSNFDGASAKLIKQHSEDKITITKAGGGSITLNAELKRESNQSDPSLLNTFSVTFAVQYKEASSGGSSSGGGGSSVTPTTPSQDVKTDTKTGTTTVATDVKVSEKTNADGTKEKVAEVKVSAANQKEILKQAKESKSKDIILSVSKSEVGDAGKADVTLDKSFIESVANDTDANLTIQTPFGEKTYTKEELKKLAAEATGSTITLTIEPAADDSAAKIEKAKEIAADMQLVARSSKTAKKNIKAVLKSDAKVKASIKELKDLGFTVKYCFYRSTKKAASYKSTVTKKTATYTNTSGKKGTKYFYKVQVRVYDENGKLITKTALKQCKYASRTWTK